MSSEAVRLDDSNRLIQVKQIYLSKNKFISNVLLVIVILIVVILCSLLFVKNKDLKNELTAMNIKMQFTLNKSNLLENKYRWQSTILSSYISMDYLLGNGFQIVYNQFYSHATQITELIAIKNKCTKQSVICVGGADSLTNTLLLVSCGSCLKILTNSTVKDQPTYINGAWWYLTPGYSFGFAPSYNVRQMWADTYDAYNDTKRLSWHLTSNWGGWRLGTLNDQSTRIPFTFKKIILLLK